MVQRTAFISGPGPFIDHDFPANLDGQLKGAFNFFFGNQVHAGERVAVSLLKSNCSMFTEVLNVIFLAKNDTTEKISPSDLVYFVGFWIFKLIFLDLGSKALDMKVLQV